MSGVPYHAWTHAPKAQGGTDPIPPMDASTAALLTDINFETPADSVITADLWTLVTPGDGTRFFETAWSSDSGSFSIGFDGELTGTNNFTNPLNGNYVAYATVGFADAVAGNVIGAAIQFDTSGSYFHPNVITCKGGGQQVEVVAPWWGDLTAGARIWCYCDPQLELGITQFHIRLFELLSSGTIDSRP